MVKPGAVVIDVGMNRTETGLVGDVDFAGRQRGGQPDHARARRRRPADRGHAHAERAYGSSVAAGVVVEPRQRFGASG